MARDITKIVDEEKQAKRRNAILRYGQKATWRDLFRFVKTKN